MDFFGLSPAIGGGANAVGSLVFLTSRAGKKSSALLVTSGPQGLHEIYTFYTSNTTHFKENYDGYFRIIVVQDLLLNILFNLSLWCLVF